MKRLVLLCAGAVVLMSGGLFAQTKSITGETETVTATVEAIEQSTRTVTLKKADGTYEEVYVPKDFKRFNELKIGDKITARYYENIVLRVQPAGAKPVDSSDLTVTPGSGPGKGSTIAHQVTITATVTAIDMKVPSISFKGPRGWSYSSKVKDVKALEKVKVGDKVDITWTEAALISVDQAAK